MDRIPVGTSFRRAAVGLAFLLTFAVGALVLAPSVLADDLSGADQLLCASLTATRCTTDGCVTDLPSAWNIPQFIEIDLTGKILRTTAASGENRSTPIKTVVRENGKIFIQGMEGGRAFSFVIDEGSGQLDAAVATVDGVNVVFAACTPLPVGN